MPTDDRNTAGQSESIATFPTTLSVAPSPTIERPKRRNKTKAERARECPIDLMSLPYQTMQRVCILGDCSPTTVKRSGLRPVGRRGRTLVYKTSDVVAWLTGNLGDEVEPEKPRRMPMRSAPVANDIGNRLDAIRRGGGR
jgi:hypothetical protein